MCNKARTHGKQEGQQVHVPCFTIRLFCFGKVKPDRSCNSWQVALPLSLIPRCLSLAHPCSRAWTIRDDWKSLCSISDKTNTLQIRCFSILVLGGATKHVTARHNLTGIASLWMLIKIQAFLCKDKRNNELLQFYTKITILEWKFPLVDYLYTSTRRGYVLQFMIGDIGEATLSETQ